MSKEEMLAILGIILALVGAGLVLMPRVMLRLRGGESLWLVAWFVELFPDRARPWVGRGVGLCLAAAGAGLLVVYGEDGLFEKKKPETLKEWKDEAYDSDAYRGRVITEGPAYSQKVIDQLRSLRRWYYYESPESMVIVVVHPETFQVAKVGFLEALDVAPSRIAREISGTLEAALKDDLADLQRGGTLEQEMAKRRQMYGPKIARQMDEAYRAAAGSQSMQLAEANLKKAADYWQLEDKQSAVRFARDAREGFAAVLGPYHPKVKEVDRMIEAAGR